MRTIGLVLSAMLAASCSGDQRVTESPAATASAPRDAQHQGVTGPHGDHAARHGGLVLMNGDVHYEVVLAASGRHQVWFSDATRNELPASVASGVTIDVMRPGAAAETVLFTIDQAGEAWVASSRPLDGDGISVKVRYRLQGEPHEIEIPYSASGK